MLISYVLHPSAICNDWDKSDLRSFIRSVRDLGLIVIDSEDGELLKRLNEKFKGLHSKHKRSADMWLEIQEPKRNRIRSVFVTANSECVQELESSESKVFPEVIHKSMKTDGFVCPHGESHKNRLEPGGYGDSRFESSYESFGAGLSRINKKTKEEFEAFLSGALKYSKWIKLYDTQIGRTDRKNLEYIKNTINYFLDVWNKYSLYPNDAKKFTIYTTANFLEHRAKTMKQTRREIEEDLLEPLRESHDHICLKLEIMAGDRKIDHDRYLTGENFIINSSTSFDTYNGKKFRKAFKLIPTRYPSYSDDLAHLQEYEDMVKPKEN